MLDRAGSAESGECCFGVEPVGVLAGGDDELGCDLGADSGLGEQTGHGVVEKAARRRVRVYITGASASVRRVLTAHAVREPLAIYRPTIADAVAEAHAGNGS